MNDANSGSAFRIGVLVAVALVVVGGLVGLVAYAASSDERWPWLLDYVR